MFHYVYVIQSQKGGNLYVGYTADLRKRPMEHNHKSVFSTKPYVPWRLIHYEAYLNERDAKRRERYLKTSQGARLLKRMLKEYFYSQRWLTSQVVETRLAPIKIGAERKDKTILPDR